MTPAQVASADAERRARVVKVHRLADVLQPRLAAFGWSPNVLTDPDAGPSRDLVWALAEHAADVDRASETTRRAVVEALHRRTRVAALPTDDPFAGLVAP